MRYTLRQLEIFVAIARTENVSRAAAQLKLSQSAASSALVELERMFDRPLFDRVGKSLYLNSTGRGLLDKAEALLIQASEIETYLTGSGPGPLAIGATMRSTGRLYAFDVSAHRLDALKPRLARSGLSNVHPVAIAHERDERVKRLAGKIDRVLVDAPCSGLGTLRRNPDLKWRQSPQALEELVAKQTAILESAARLPKSGGRLVYATCSMLPQENEAIAEAFTQAHRDFEPLDAGELLAQLKVPEAASLCSGGESGSRFVRLWPHRHQTDGFFAAVWQRK